MTTTEPVPGSVDEPRRDGAPTDSKVLTTADLARGSLARPAREGEARSFSDSERASKPDASSTPDEPAAPLFSEAESGDLRAKWDAIQTGFVDEPRKAVEQADSLVAGAMQRLAEIFARERSGLEGQWDRGDDVSTEDLRLALRRYRSFFSRLLSV